jgi:O-antigen/teichoic acid export membrane protein
LNSQNTSLKKRAVYAGGWSLLNHFVAQALRLGSNIVLTRLLVPELFGVMSLAVAFLIALTMFSDVGLQQNVVQHAEDDDKDFLNTIWTAQIIRGAFIAVLGVGIASALAAGQTIGLLSSSSAYGHPDLPFAVAIISGTGLIAGFNSTNLLSAGRRLQIGSVVVVDLVAQVSGTVVTLAWALYSPTILSVVSGAVVSAIVRCLLSHRLIPGVRNRLRWDPKHYRTIHHLGIWVFLSSVLGFLVNAGDRLLFGGILTPTDFGIYAVALLLTGAPIEAVMRLVSSVIYPSLAEVNRRDPAGLRDVYYRFRLFIDPAAFFLCGVIVAASNLIVDVLFGDAFAPMATILPIIALSLLVAGHLAAGNLYMLTGRPRMMTLLILLRVITLYSLGPILASRYGMAGAAWAVAAAYLILIPPNLYLKRRYNFLRFGRELLGVPFLLAGYGMGWLLERAGALL